MAAIHPTQILIERALKVLTEEDFKTFIESLEAVKEDGFGSVAIEFERHHPEKIHVTGTISRLLRAMKSKTYKPE